MKIESEKKDNSIESLKQELDKVLIQVRTLKNALEEKNKVKIDVMVRDPVPSDSEARNAYVARVAGFFVDILEPKLKHMISNSYFVLEDTNNSQNVDNMLKGAIYAFREILLWGETLTNEYKGDLVENRESSKSPEEQLRNLLT